VTAPARVAELAALFAAVEARALGRRLARGRTRPGWSLRTELAVAAMKGVLERSKRRGIPWLRDAQTGVLPRSRFLRQVRFAALDAGGVAARWCTPSSDPAPRRTIVYLHGGGYVIGSVDTHRESIARLAVQAQARVLGVDYRLAPEHRFPTAHDDCLAAVRWAIAAGAEPRRLALAGDSAGGALAAATLTAMRDAGEPLPAAAVLISPWVDPLASGGSMESNEPFDFGDRDLLVGWIEAYLGRDAPRDPRVFLLEAKLDGLPPLFIQAGGAEILLDQVRAFAERARASGVDVRLDVHDDMFHDFQMQAALIPEGARAMDDVARFLHERLA
jgi:epsilon-lactone hydrolase